MVNRLGAWFLRIATIIPVFVPKFLLVGSIEKEKLGPEKPQKVHSETLGCVKVRGTPGLSMNLQKPQVYERENGGPEKGETKDGLISPHNQGDDRRDA